jgi:hypothetical protein
MRYLCLIFLLTACSLIKVTTKTKDKSVFIHDTTVVYTPPVIDTVTQVHSDTTISVIQGNTDTNKVDTVWGNDGDFHGVSWATKTVTIHDTVKRTVYDVSSINQARDSTQKINTLLSAATASATSFKSKYHGAIWYGIASDLFLLLVITIMILILKNKK